MGVSAPESRLTLRREDAAFAAGFLASAIGWDARAACRVSVQPQAVGLFCSTPNGCVAFAAVPAFQTTRPGDRTVSAGRLRDVIGDVSTPQAGLVEVRLPDDVSTPSELMLLPPTSGWELVGTETAGELESRVSSAVERFRSLVPARESDSPPVRSEAAVDADRIAEDLWAADAWRGAPMRLLHTAHQFGFLREPTAMCHLGRADGWYRLQSPAGQVFAADDVQSLARLLP